MNLENEKSKFFFIERPLKNILKQLIHIKSQDENKITQLKVREGVCVCVNVSGSS